MCHVDLVWETEGLVFVRDSHACPVSLHSAASNLHFTSYRKLQHRQKHTHTQKKTSLHMVQLACRNDFGRRIMSTFSSTF